MIIKVICDKKDCENHKMIEYREGSINWLCPEHEKKKAQDEVTYEEPIELTPQTVIKWSNTYKQLEMLESDGKFKTYSIRAKAKKFIENNCIDYIKKQDSEFEKGYYICKPIKGYNKSTYKMFSLPDHEFDCSCQFHQKVIQKQKIPGLICSHVLALKLQLKMWNYNRRKDKELNPEAYQ